MPEDSRFINLETMNMPFSLEAEQSVLGAVLGRGRQACCGS